MQAMQDWHKSHPQVFVKSPRNHTGCDMPTGSVDWLFKAYGRSPEGSAAAARRSIARKAK